MVDVAENEILASKLGQDFRNHLVVSKHITRVKKQQILPTRHPDAFVHGIVDAAVWLTDPLSDVVAMFFYQRSTAICGSAVNHNPLEIPHRLRLDTLNRVGKPLEIIVIDCDD